MCNDPLHLHLQFTVNTVGLVCTCASLEIQKFLGSLWFGWDIEMYDAAQDIPAQVNTSDLNEDLGQVRASKCEQIT